MKHCAQCGERLPDDCWCGYSDDDPDQPTAEPSSPDHGWAGRGYRP